MAHYRAPIDRHIKVIGSTQLSLLLLLVLVCHLKCVFHISPWSGPVNLGQRMLWWIETDIKINQAKLVLSYSANNFVRAHNTAINIFFGRHILWPDIRCKKQYKGKVLGSNITRIPLERAAPVWRVHALTESIPGLASWQPQTLMPVSKLTQSNPISSNWILRNTFGSYMEIGQTVLQHSWGAFFLLRYGTINIRQLTLMMMKLKENTIVSTDFHKIE